MLPGTHSYQNYLGRAQIEASGCFDAHYLETSIVLTVAQGTNGKAANFYWTQGGIKFQFVSSLLSHLEGDTL